MVAASDLPQELWLNVMAELGSSAPPVVRGRFAPDVDDVNRSIRAPLKSLLLSAKVCKLWRTMLADPESWRLFCMRRWPSLAHMSAQTSSLVTSGMLENSKRLFAMLSEPRVRYFSHTDYEYEMPYQFLVSNLAIKSSERRGEGRLFTYYDDPQLEPGLIRYDKEMLEVQRVWKQNAEQIKKGAVIEHTLTGGTLANLWLMIDIHSKGGKHLVSRAINGPPTACLYKEKEGYRDVKEEYFHQGNRERGFWECEAPLPPDWEKLEKKVTAYFVDPVVGKALLILDRQTKCGESFYDVTKPIECNAIEATPLKVSYGNQDAMELLSCDEGSEHPLLNIEQQGSTLKISLHVTISCHDAFEGWPASVASFLEVLRAAGMAPADERRLPEPLEF